MSGCNAEVGLKRSADAPSKPPGIDALERSALALA